MAHLKNYVPMEGLELTPVESDKVKSLALLALQVGSLNEAGNHSQATSGKNILGLQPRTGSWWALIIAILFNWGSHRNRFAERATIEQE